MQGQPRSTWWKRVLMAAALFTSAANAAETDTVKLGTGRDGNLEVRGAGHVINTYAQLAGPAAPGDTVLLTRAAESFSAGQLLLVHQTTGLAAERFAGVAAPIDLSREETGRWELVRVASASAGTLELQTPLRHSYAALVTQVIRVPEYKDVSIAAGSSVVGKPWDGSTGGVVAFLATGRVRNEGLISARGAGFRGGLSAVDPACQALGQAGCEKSQVAEGVASFGAAVRAGGASWANANVANAGGSGALALEGGGGGAHGGAGGQGSGLAERARRGMGGAPLLYDMDSHLSLGGGGGAGADGQTGGRGGGLLFLRGQELLGQGALSADGEAAQGGAGGGGAGGAVLMRFEGAVDCGALTARGGRGGTTAEALDGAGGGGGGGRMRIVAGTLSTACQAGIDVSGASQERTLTQAAVRSTAGQRGTVSIQMTAQLADTNPPVTTISNSPPNPTNQTSISISFSATDEGVACTNCTFECRLNSNQSNGNNYTACTSPFTRSGLTEDTYTFSVRAIDAAGNVDLFGRTATFTVDLTPPTVTVTAPTANQILGTATPTFTGTTEANSEVRIIVNGRPYITNTSTTNWSFALPGADALPDGSYSLSVYAIDAAGNQSATVNVPFSVDTVPPDTTLTPQFTSPSNQTTGTFTFSATEPATYECNLDGAGWAACSTPYTTPALADGSHTLQVRAIDRAGKVDDTPATYTWIVDTVPPVAPVITGPTSGAVLTTRTPAITGTAEPNSTVEVFIDGVSAGTTTADAAGNWSLTPTTALADGAHSVTATATDPATNTSQQSPAVNFTVDATPPDVTITSAPPASTTSTSATFEFSSSDPTATFECKLDSGAYAPCTSPKSYSNLSVASHTFEVRAKDRAGNVSAPASHTWSVTRSGGGCGCGCSVATGTPALAMLSSLLLISLRGLTRRNKKRGLKR